MEENAAQSPAGPWLPPSSWAGLGSLSSQVPRASGPHCGTISWSLGHGGSTERGPGSEGLSH